MNSEVLCPPNCPSAANFALALEIDFIPQHDRVSLRYLFASEEYYKAETPKNDALAIFLGRYDAAQANGIDWTVSGEPGGNIALLPDVTQPAILSFGRGGIRMSTQEILLAPCFLLGLLVTFWLPNSLPGAIVYSGSQDVVLNDSAEGSLVLNMGDGENLLEIRDERGGFVLAQREWYAGYSTVISEPDGRVTAMEMDTRIDANLHWNSVFVHLLLGYAEPNVVGRGDFFDRSNSFAGIRVLDEDDIYFGWIHMSHSMEEERLIIHDWAWNSVSGEPIHAGEIPEPHTVSLLAGLAALTVVFFGRRRKPRARP